MKILWLNDFCSFVGGAEKYVYETAKLLKEKYNVENHLLYNVENRVDVRFTQPFDFVTVVADLKLQLDILKPDIIYVHQLSNPLWLKILSECKYPVVAFIHDHKYFCLREHKYTTIGSNTCTQTIGMNCYTCLGFLNKQETFPYIKIKTVGELEKIQSYYKEFNSIIVGSRYMKEHLLAHGFSIAKVRKNPLYIDTKVQEIQKYQGIKKRLLFVGQLVRGKGIDTLLQSLSKLNDKSWVLDICGDGVQKQEFENLANELGIKDQVIFHGQIHKEDLDEFYKNAYLVVIPSRSPETFNLVGLEAMAYGKAVIASNVGGITEWLEDQQNGSLFESTNIDQLKERIEILLADESYVQNMGEKGQELFLQKFQAKNHIEKLYVQFLNIKG